MKYTIGQQLFYAISTNIEKCTVVGLLEKTNRYRVEYTLKWINGNNYKVMAERDLFPTANECIDSQISDLMNRISILQSQIVKWQEEKLKVVD